MDIYEYHGKQTIEDKTAPGFLTVDNVKPFIRVTDTTDTVFDAENDQIIEDLISAVYDKFEKKTGRYLLPATIKMQYNLCGGESEICATVPHVDITVDSIKLYAEDGTEYTIDSDYYSVDSMRGVVAIYDTSIPSILRRFDNFEINYTTSMYADDASVSQDVHTALKQAISHWYENRQSVTEYASYEVVDSAKSTFKKYSKRRR